MPTEKYASTSFCRSGSRPRRLLRPRTRFKAGVAFGVFIALLAGRSEAEPSGFSECAGKARPMARLELLFGANFRGGVVGPRAFARFIDEEVTPRFPLGSSVFDGHGQWRGASGRLIREPSRMLLIWYEPGKDSEGAIEAIRFAYKKRFKQQSVLRADGMSCVSF